MIYVLDTDSCSLAFYSSRGVRERIDQERKANEVVISLATRIEVLRGRFDAVLKAEDGILRAQEVLRLSEEYLEQFRILPFTAIAVSELEKVRKRKLSGKPRLADLIIAAITLAHRATLVTRNTKDFAGIPGLKFENWAA